MRFLIMALALSAAFWQTNRIFQVTQDENKQELEEIATVLRGTGDIQQVSLDDIKRTLTVEGTAGQIAMADWLVRQMDLPANGEFSGPCQYRPPAGGDIDNAEAAVAEGGEGITIKAGAVRAAVMDDAGHAGEQRVGRGVRGACDESCNAAHKG